MCSVNNSCCCHDYCCYCYHYYYSQSSLLPMLLILALSPPWSCHWTPAQGRVLAECAQLSRFILFVSRPIVLFHHVPATPWWMCLVSSANMPAAYPVDMPSPPSLLSPTYILHPHIRKLPPTSQSLSTSWSLLPAAKWTWPSQLTSRFLGLEYAVSCFTFSASWSPSSISATSIYPCLKSNFFWLLNPFQSISHFLEASRISWNCFNAT